jgi:glycosyltransferase involved in cell wall biosynthesis
VLEQEGSYRVEVIVVDDGSEDNTQESLSDYRNEISYIRQSNKGINAARNAGIAKANGRYVALLDSDDVWLPFKTDVQVRLLDALPDVAFAFSDFFIWKRDQRMSKGLETWNAFGTVLEDSFRETLPADRFGISTEGKSISVAICDIYHLSLFRPVVLPSTSMIRRKAIEDFGLLPEASWMCGDWEFFAELSLRHGSVYIDIETALNRSHDDPVRLMRRDISERTKQRIESIRHTWRRNTEFSENWSSDIDRVEAHEWAILFKRACATGNRSEAAYYLEKVSSLLGRTPLRLLLHRFVSALPGYRFMRG